MHHIHRSLWLLLLVLCLLAGCGQPESGASQALARSSFSVFPDVPAYPGSTHMLMETLPGALFGLGATTPETVEVRTIPLAGTHAADLEDIRTFYREALPSLGWEALSLYPGGTLYRQHATGEQHIGLLVSVASARSVMIEMVRFTADAPVMPFPVAFRAGPTWDSSLFDPQGIAVSPTGAVYVAFERDHRMQRFSEQGIATATWGGTGSAPGMFGADSLGPQGVAIGSDAAVYVADPFSGRVQKFAPDGTFLLTIGALGSGPGQLGIDSYRSIQGIAIDNHDRLYVVDRANERIVQFTSAGQFLTDWPLMPPADQRVRDGNWLAVAPDGRMYVTVSFTDAINVYAPDGTLLESWGGTGIGPGRFQSPQGIAVRDNQVYVVDRGNQRVQIFSLDGQLLGIVGDTPNGGRAQGPIGTGIAITTRGTILMADQAANAVVVYTPAAGGMNAVGSAPPAPHPTQLTTPQLPSLPTQDEWRARARAWLRQEPCAPPCWAGITPGVTTAGEAQAVLKAHPMVDPASVVIFVRTTSHSAEITYILAWQWIGNAEVNEAHLLPGPGLPVQTDSGGMPSRTADQRAHDEQALDASVITTIEPDFAAYGTDLMADEQLPWRVLSVGEVVTAYGPPDHVMMAQFRQQTELRLVYEQRGFVIDSHVSALTDFGPATDASQIIFTIQPTMWATQGYSAGVLRPWHGFTTPQTYCTHETTGQACP